MERLRHLPDDEPKYAKSLDTIPVPWRTFPSSFRDSEFVLRITLGEMPIEDSFWIGLPEDITSLSLRELFAQVFPRDASLQQPFLQRLDLNRNPDLSDMYDALVDIFARVELGMCAVDTYRNQGPKLSDSTVVDHHLTMDDTLPVLDLVLEQRFSAIDYAVRRGEFADQDEALAWMRSRVLLYFLDAPDYVLPSDPVDITDTVLLPIAQTLIDEGLLERPAEPAPFEITELGHETINEMTAEVENVLERYEVFGDVLYDPETGECDFGTGVGDDLRIPVYEAEAVSPVRAILLVELCDGELAQMADDWRTAIHEREFFKALLLPVVERPLVDEEDIDAIIDAGFALMEQQAQEASLADEDAQLRRSVDLY